MVKAEGRKRRYYSVSDLFGKAPQVRIIEALAENAGEIVSVPYIEEITGVAKSTVYQYIYKFCEDGLVEKVGKGEKGKTQYYQLNENDERAKVIIMLESLMVSEFLAEKIHESGGKTFFDEIAEYSVPPMRRLEEEQTVGSANEWYRVESPTTEVLEQWTRPRTRPEFRRPPTTPSWNAQGA